MKLLAFRRAHRQVDTGTEVLTCSAVLIAFSRAHRQVDTGTEVLTCGTVLIQSALTSLPGLSLIKADKPEGRLKGQFCL